MDNFNRLMKYERSGRENAPKYQYLDIEICNSSGSDQFINYVESRTSPYVDRANDYWLSIVRFIIPTFHLPLFIPIIKDPSNDVNETVYSFSMSYKTYKTQKFMDFVTPNQDITTPASGGEQNMRNDYYFVYSYNYVVTLLNACLSECYDNLKTLVEDGSDTLPGSDHIPFLLFDPSSKSMVLYANKDGFASTLADPIYIYCNDAMYNLLAGFEYIRNKSLGTGMDYKFNIQQSLSNLAYFDDYTAVVMSEEFSSVSNWSPISSIVFVSNTLPINKTMVGKPNQFGSQSFSGSISSVTQSIITDISIGDFMDSKLIYSPYFLRMIDLVGSDNITQIDLRVFFKDRYGNLYNYVLPNNSSFYIKLAFIRKY
jgi:hypothetical protein